MELSFVDVLIFRQTMDPFYLLIRSLFVKFRVESLIGSLVYRRSHQMMDFFTGVRIHSFIHSFDCLVVLGVFESFTKL